MRAVLLSLAFAAGLATAACALPTTTLSIDTASGHPSFKVEMANDPASQERGLMYRKAMAADAGMLFDFHKEQMVTFWMKNTILPLDLIFIRADGTISSIAGNAVPYSEAPIPSSEPIRAVLEINAGRAKALGIEPGDRVKAAIFAARH
ncbi:MAG: DUF192 domain-containing protein [Alphaproteobacteria bacterium]|nr:DUF192 domain-containing protein [Alphaproteobacteria bacterium]